MRQRVVLWIALGANVALAAMLLSLARIYAPNEPTVSFSRRPPEPPKVVKTNVVVRRQNFVWNQIESDDYRTFITNLRRIGCPETTIRDIIVADVNQLYARRRATEIVTAEQQWWRSEPDLDIAEEAAKKLRELDNERRALLTSLLGPEWESSYYPYPQIARGNPLDGPILGALTPDQKHAVHDLEARALERRQEYLDAARKAGRDPDPAELERLRKETRTELARLLNPEQLEQYLLRYSNQANTLRNELRGLEVSAAEFRDLFRLREGLLDPELQTLTAATDPASVKRRAELEAQQEAELKKILGQERYQEYRLNQDPLFRDSRALVQQTGADIEKLLPLYEINHATEVEQRRIRGDASLTAEERIQALQSVRASHEIALRKLLGEEAYQKYLEGQKQ